jgi:hypothetical protein
VRARPLLALLAAAAACRSARPVAQGAAARADALESADAGALDAGGSFDAGAPDPLAEADALFARGAVGPAIAACEEAALYSQAPSPFLVRAAGARRQRVAAALASADPASSLSAVAEDAEACAADAHRAWSAQFPTAAAQIDGAQPLAGAYAQVGPSGAEALYLEAVCSAQWARTQGFTQLVERRLELAAELQRAAELAPALDSAGPDRELGALYAALPSYAGGDLALARHYFEAAGARAPGAAANHLDFARSVAVKAQDRQLFETQLRLAAASIEPGAAVRAAELLSREDDLFGPAEAAQPTPGGVQK